MSPDLTVYYESQGFHIQDRRLRGARCAILVDGAQIFKYSNDVAYF